MPNHNETLSHQCQRYLWPPQAALGVIWVAAVTARNQNVRLPRPHPPAPATLYADDSFSPAVGPLTQTDSLGSKWWGKDGSHPLSLSHPWSHQAVHGGVEFVSPPELAYCLPSSSSRTTWSHIPALHLLCVLFFSISFTSEVFTWPRLPDYTS